MLIKVNVAPQKIHVMKEKVIVRVILNAVEVLFVELTTVNNLEMFSIQKMTAV